ncbi:MAG: DUF2066 domain-containing protein [Hyphomicrobiaceae bacterium]
MTMMNRGGTRRRERRQWSGIVALGAAMTVALAAVLSSGAAFARPANDKVFTIANYPVQAKAANAVAAKEQAIAEGQKSAFRSLLKRLVPVMAYSRLKALKETDPQGLVDGYVVRSERNSTTEYIASLDFSFRADAVRNLLRREAVPFIEEQASEVVLVAAVREGGKLARSGSVANAWLDIWRDLDLMNALTPLKLAEIKPFVHDDTLNMLVAGDESANRVLANEYGGESVIVAIAEVDQPGHRVHVTLAGRDAVGPFNLKRSYRLYDGDVGYSMELAAVVSMGVIEGRWKAVKAQRYGGVAALSAGGEPVRMQVEFQGLAEWTDVHTRVRETPGVSDVQVDAVSARGADLQVSFPGGGPALADALAARGLSLRNIGGNWFLRSSF